MFSLILCGLGCLTLRRCSAINFIYIFTTQKWLVHTSFIFMLIMLWIFSTHPPFPLVHLFYSYLCRNQAISAPPAHKHNERENTMLQHSHCLSNRLQHHWERNRDLLERRSALYLPEKLQQASSAFNYVSCKPPISLKQSVVRKKECKTWARSLLLTLRKDKVGLVEGCEQAAFQTECADMYLSTQLWWSVNNTLCLDTNPLVSKCLAGQLSYGSTRGKETTALCCHITSGSCIWNPSHEPSTLWRKAFQSAGIVAHTKADLAEPIWHAGHGAWYILFRKLITSWWTGELSGTLKY